MALSPPSLYPPNSLYLGLPLIVSAQTPQGLPVQTGPVLTSGLCTGSSSYLIKTFAQHPLLGAVDGDHPVKIGSHLAPTSPESPFLFQFFLLLTCFTIK